MKFFSKSKRELLELKEEGLQRTFTVLVIGINEGVFRLIRNQLDNSDLDFHIEEADSVPAIQSTLSGGDIDVVLSNYRLDGTSISEILKIVRNHHSRIPFIVVNGNLDKKEAVEIMRLGANDCLMKSELEQLAPVIEREISYLEKEKRLINEKNTVYHHLQERIKEQECLYKISTIDQKGLPIKEVLSRSMNILPSGFQYPEITEVKAQYDGLEYRTDDYKETPWSISYKNDSIKYGPLIFTVVYLEEKPELDDGPFMAEEKNLLDSVMNQLTIKIKQILDQKELEDQRELLERSNAMAKVGHWEVDLTQDSVHWCSEVKSIHEVSEDFNPDINEGISFYKEGYHRFTAQKAFNKAVEEGESIDEELKIVTAKGNERWIRVIGEPEFIDGTCVRVFGSFQDISDKKSRIFELEQERKRLQEAQEIGDIGDWDYDLETGDIFWSDQIYNIYGRNPDAAPPSYKELLEYYTDNGTQLHEEIGRVTQHGGKYELDLEIKTGNGTKKYVYHEGYAEKDEKGNIIKVHGIVQNITQRKQKELEIIRRENQLRSVTNNVDAVVFRYLLHPDGSDQMMFVSDNIERLYETTAEKAMSSSQSAWDLVLEEDTDLLNKSIQQSADTLEKWSHRFRIKTPSNKVKWIEGHGHPTRLKNGSVQWDTMIIDVTKQVYQEQMNDVLVQEIHHRVKNNLAIISSFLQIQLLDMSDEHYSRLPIERAVNRIFSISEVHKLLYEGSSLVNINPGKYLERLLDHIMDTMRVDSNVSLDIQVDVDSMNVNELTPLGMLMNELVTNSMKYAFDHVDDGIIKIHLSKKDALYSVVYKDNGPGVADSKLKSVKGSGFKIIELLLEQLEASYNFDTDNQFRLEFTFHEITKGSHSHHNITQPVD